VPSLYAWSRKLAARDAEQSSGKSSARFVAVDVRGASGGGAWIEIATDGTIRVPVELDAERLAAVLNAVRRALAC
jgi:hypothetical protein